MNGEIPTEHPSDEKNNIAETEISVENLGRNALSIIGKIVISSPNKYLDTSTTSNREGHVRLDDQLVEGGKTKVDFWLPPEEYEHYIKHPAKRSAGIQFYNAENNEYKELYFVDPKYNAIFDHNLRDLSPKEQLDLVGRLKNIAKELNIPSIS